MTPLKTVWVGMSNGGYVSDLVMQDQQPASTDGKTWKQVEIQSHDTTAVSAETLDDAIALMEQHKKDCLLAPPRTSCVEAYRKAEDSHQQGNRYPVYVP